MIPSKSFLSRTWAALVVLSVAAMGTAMLGGCRGEDYYCDNTGCFYCDGVGCRNVNPPTRGPCTGDYQCQAGQVCTSAGCATTCTSDTDCPRGTVCAPASGTAPRICVAPTEMPPTRTPGSCSSNADCTGNAVCIDGTCRTSTTPACNVDADCTGGNICINHTCTARTNTCQFNNQCGAGRVCVNSECRAACGATSPCPTGQTCNASSFCEDAPSTSCVHDAECGTGQHCLNGECLQACVAGSMGCNSSELYCSDQGVCLPDTRPRPFCTSDSQCAPGSACVNGVCRAPCMTDLQCQMRDVTYRNCGHIPNQPSITQTYCLTDSERAPTCTLQSDCTRGQSCLDGICR